LTIGAAAASAQPNEAPPNQSLLPSCSISHACSVPQRGLQRARRAPEPQQLAKAPIRRLVLRIADFLDHTGFRAGERIARQHSGLGPAFLNVFEDRGRIEDRFAVHQQHGDSLRGLAAAKAVSRRPVPKSPGSVLSNGMPFSRRTIFTFCT
jgi:hypothetical protein